jgi:methionine synthase II (cobalamin-independent)
MRRACLPTARRPGGYLIGFRVPNQCGPELCRQPRTNSTEQIFFCELKRVANRFHQPPPTRREHYDLGPPVDWIWSKFHQHAIGKTIYPGVATFWDDIALAYRKEVEALIATYVDCLNRAVKDRPDNVTISIHICRGNRHGHNMAEGGYDAVADYLFNNIDVDNYYLEFDSPRAGGFEPLRFMPSGKSGVLGLITTKRAQLESVDELCHRIDQASQYLFRGHDERRYVDRGYG